MTGSKVTKVSAASSLDVNRDASPVTLLIIASPIPTHPSDWILREVLDSIQKFIPQDSIKEVIISHDGVRKGTPRPQVEAYQRYLSKVLSLEFSIPHSVVIHKRHLHISGQLEALVPRVLSPFVLVVQHDLAFSSEVPVDDLVGVMVANPAIKHIRFNRRPNIPKGWDTSYRSLWGTVDRYPYFKELIFQGRTREISLTRTLSWSDNNYLTTTAYLAEVVIPLVRGTNASPEQVINPLNSVQTHGTFGTYIYGSVGQDAVLSHLDGRSTGANPKPFKSGFLRIKLLRRRVKWFRKKWNRGKRKLLSFRFEVVGRIRFLVHFSKR